MAVTSKAPTGACNKSEGKLCEGGRRQTASRRPFPDHLRAGQPYGPRRCGGPEHSAGYRVYAEYASCDTRRRTRLCLSLLILPAQRRENNARRGYLNRNGAGMQSASFQPLVNFRNLKAALRLSGAPCPPGRAGQASFSPRKARTVSRNVTIEIGFER